MVNNDDTPVDNLKISESTKKSQTECSSSGTQIDDLSVETIGLILSRLDRPDHVVLASATCRKWQEAFHKHLHKLVFNYGEEGDWNADDRFSTRSLEILITKTIFQTTGLRDLTIVGDTKHEFSDSIVIAWLEYTKRTLSRLVCNVNTDDEVNFLDICGWPKLEVLDLSRIYVNGIQPSFHRFPCLKSLALSRVSVSPTDLSHLVSACPKIETLHLFDLNITQHGEFSDSDGEEHEEAGPQLRSSTLRTLIIDDTRMRTLVLEADGIEYLHLKDSTFQAFNLVSKGSLKHLEIEKVECGNFDIGDSTDNLEILEVSEFKVVWLKFFEMISKLSKLKILKLWTLSVETARNEIVKFDSIAVSFPQLNHLCLSFNPEAYDQHGFVQFDFGGSLKLENVVDLEVRWELNVVECFDWVEGLLRCCPNVLKLTVHQWPNSDDTRCCIGKNYSRSMTQFLRKYMDINVELVYE